MTSQIQLHILCTPAPQRLNIGLSALAIPRDSRGKEAKAKTEVDQCRRRPRRKDVAGDPVCEGMDLDWRTILLALKNREMS